MTMATNGLVKLIVVLLSLIFSITAHTDYYQRPITRMRPGQHMSDMSDSVNETNAHTNIGTRSASINHDNVSSQNSREYDGQIVYPEETTCTYGLCFNVAGYPKDRIKKLLSRSQFMNEYFESSEEPVVLDNRFNTDEMSMCDTMVHTIYPEKANNTKQIEKLIVNVEGHKQGIVVETCANNGKCKFSDNFPDGFTSYCQQKFIHKRLMVLGEGDKIVLDSFEVPSCCVCTVKRTN